MPTTAPPPPSLELFTWGPAWTLTSFDPFCLSVETYLQLAGVEWSNNVCNDPEVSPFGELPMLRDGLLEPVVGVGRTIAYLKKKGYDLDAHLSPIENAESLAYITLIEDKLYDALLYSWWLESTNVARSTRPTIARSLRGWAGWTVPTQMQKKAAARLARYRFVTGKDGKSVNEIYRHAREWYAVLAAKLADKPFFFGDTPTTLDAIAYAHLSLHAIPTLASPTLFSILTFEHPTLHRFIDRMHNLAFVDANPVRMSPAMRMSAWDLITWPAGIVRRKLASVVNGGVVSGSGSTSPPAPAQQTDKHTPPTTPEKTKQSRQAQFASVASVVGAVGFFVGFVWYNGIVQVSFGEDDEEDERGEDGKEGEVVYKFGTA
ncbi:uncharacterized protein EV422DRAFT_513196 [Fimicolochytrium jonesii]|uniref:uncharacterized protein n=1 Tax=Fimicolochytrium jonesii TaxID=1396493 RepID=UPI0022FECB3A|nr:uncharacterized protein EV422DRAFT_513196 [Fimicolochytrium jonesii]KAI8827250.1 hypothetical protein EV422DRAFT_513196 [Fimicolochytrium jonesii]